MKKMCLLMSICVSLITLVNASVWEGAAAAASGNELPDNGLFIATNSFPVNTEVIVTNLENGITTKAIAYSTLDTPGLLALLSKDAANAIGLQSRSLGRISMTQSSDPVASPRVSVGLGSGDPDHDPAAFAALNGYDTSSPESGGSDETEAAVADGMGSGDSIVDLADGNSQPTETPLVGSADVPAENSNDTVPVISAEVPSAEVPAVEAPPVSSAAAPAAVPDESTVPGTGPAAVPAPWNPETDYELSLTPAESRPPESAAEPDASYIIPELSSAPVNPAAGNSQDTISPNISPVNPDFIDPSLIIAPVKEAPLAAEQPAVAPPVEPVTPQFSAPQAGPVFSAPLISRLEKGMYYLQIGAYSKVESVQSEIARLDNKLPLAIMNAGNAGKPIYRILIGPVNLGESGALLQRFKASYKDAFVRLGT